MGLFGWLLQPRHVINATTYLLRSHLKPCGQEFFQDRKAFRLKNVIVPANLLVLLKKGQCQTGWTRMNPYSSYACEKREKERAKERERECPCNFSRSRSFAMNLLRHQMDVNHHRPRGAACYFPPSLSLSISLSLSLILFE